MQVVALEAGLVGCGEHLAGDVVSAAGDRRLGVRDDRHPAVRAEFGGGWREACEMAGGDVQVGDVRERLVCMVAQAVAAQLVCERE